MITSLWDALPQGRFVGNASRIPHEQILFIASLIDSSGIAERIDRWQEEDRVALAPGGRPRTVSTRTVLILVLLLAVEHSAQLVEEVAVIAHQRLAQESRDYLGLGGKKGISKGRRRTKAQWYFVMWRALHRALAPIDPKPRISTPRGKFPTLDEVNAMKASWKSEALYEKHARLKLVCADLIEATMQLVPREFADNWKGDVCVDASVIPVYAKRGAPFGGKLGSIEPTAGWYVRDSNHNIPTDKKKVKKAIYGYDATVLVQTNHDPTALANFPVLIVGMGLTVPATNLIGTAREIFEDVVRRGHPVGRSTGDRGYAPMAKPEEYQIPLRLLGYDIVTDYNDDQLGENSGAEFEGAMQVEGAWYCPSMPADLVSATVDLRAGTIDNRTWRERIRQRRQYLLRAKEKPDAKGRVPMMCPARGPGATALCPLVDVGCGTAATDVLTPITNPPDEAHQGLICTNKTSVTIPVKAGAKHSQTLQYGSDDWELVYKSDRNHIEGTNGFFKDSSKEGVSEAGRRRIRGLAGQQLALCFLYVTVNLRKIQKFRDEYVNYTPAERADRAERKLEVRARRKARKDRPAPWDDFAMRARQQKLDDEKQSADVQKTRRRKKP